MGIGEETIGQGFELCGRINLGKEENKGEGEGSGEEKQDFLFHTLQCTIF